MSQKRNSGKAHLPSLCSQMLRQRYLRKDENGRVIETPRQLFWRVGKAVAAVETGYPSSLLSEDESQVRKDDAGVIGLGKYCWEGEGNIPLDPLERCAETTRKQNSGWLCRRSQTC